MSNHRGKEKNSRLRVRPAIAHTTRRRLTKTNFNMGDWGGQQQGGGYQGGGGGGGGGWGGGGGYQEQGGGGGGNNSYGGSWGGGGGRGGGGGGNVRPGDWQCPAGCGNVFASKMNCFKCGQPRPENAEVASGEQVRRAAEGHGHQEPRSANPRNSFLTC